MRIRWKYAPLGVLIIALSVAFIIYAPKGDSVAGEATFLAQLLSRFQGVQLPSESPNFKNVLIASTDTTHNIVHIEVQKKTARPLTISGWSVAVGQERVAVPQVASPLLQGKVSREENAVFYPGDSAFLMFSESPVGYSFEVTACTGYLSQFQDFVPVLPKACPAPDRARFSENGCYSYALSTPTCSIPQDIPESLGEICAQELLTAATYNACLSDHMGDPNFGSGEFRLYLGGGISLEKGTRIMLLDAEEFLVDEAIIN